MKKIAKECALIFALCSGYCGGGVEDTTKEDATVEDVDTGQECIEESLEVNMLPRISSCMQEEYFDCSQLGMEVTDLGSLLAIVWTIGGMCLEQEELPATAKIENGVVTIELSTTNGEMCRDDCNEQEKAPENPENAKCTIVPMQIKLGQCSIVDEVIGIVDGVSYRSGEIGYAI